MFLAAAQSGDLNLLQAIHRLCGDSVLNVRDGDEYTALHKAAYNGHMQVSGRYDKELKANGHFLKASRISPRSRSECGGAHSGRVAAASLCLSLEQDTSSFFAVAEWS